MISTISTKKPNLQYFWAIVLLVIGFSILLKLPTFNLPHHEGDEVRLWYLAKNWAVSGHYTLQGSPLFEIFPHYEPYYAHRKMPVHPPLFPALLRPFVQYEFTHYEKIPQPVDIATIEAIYTRIAPRYAVIASWIGHLLAILAVALIARYLLLYHKLSLSALSPLFWLPLLGIATDPIMTWVSTKIWIDNLHAGLAALSVALAMMASSSRYSQMTYFLSGILLGLALLSKITAAIIIPVLIFIVFVHETDTKKRIQALLWGSMPALVLSLPWYIPRYLPQLMIEKIPVGKILENPPINEYRGMCEFCGAATTRQFYYFLVKLPLISPLIIIGLSFYVTLFFAYVRKLALLENLRFLVPVIWFLFVLSAVTLYLSFYGTFIMRRITLLIPSLYVMFYMLIIYSEKIRRLRKYQPILLFLGSLSIVYGAISGGYYLLLGNKYAEFFSLTELAGIVKLW
jgi:4-amino-4-deoxy-L-arabinose transferase-like glycosyltransferase